MSHNSERNRVRDPSRPFLHRASSARSCAIHVANRLGMKRDELIALVEVETGISLHRPGTPERLMLAFEHMQRMGRAVAPEGDS